MIDRNIRHLIHQNQTFVNAILSPASADNDWQDIEVVTLKQAAIDKATDYVLANVVAMTDVNAQLVNELSAAEYQINREFVSITPEKITIAIMCDKVTDHIINKAIKMLMAIKSLTPGTYYYGPEHILDFSYTDSAFSV